MAGGFDSFGTIRRSQFFTEDNNNRPFIEIVTKYGSRFQENKDSSQVSMFGGDSAIDIPVPQPPIAEEWPTLTQLSKEKEVVGVYISGHPLDDYKLEIDSFCNGCSVSDLNALEENKGKDLSIAGIITSAEHRTTKNGKPFGTFEIEDYTESSKQFVFGENYLRFKHLFTVGTFVFLNGKVGPRKWGEGLEFGMSSMELLADVKEKRTKTLVLSVEQSDLTDMIIDDLYTVVSDHVGTCALKFVLRDHKSKTSLKMPSKNMKVNVNKKLIDSLDRLEIFDCKLE